jgi:oligoendopeptidase F
MNQINTEWNLADIYKSPWDKQIQLDEEKIEKLVENFIQKYQGKIESLQTAEYLDLFVLDSQIDKLVNKIGSYFYFYTSIHTKDLEVRNLQIQFDQKINQISQKTIFISQELKSLGYEKLIKLSKNKILTEYQNFFVKLANAVKYILDYKSESFLLNLENQNNQAIQTQRHFFETLTYRLDFGDGAKNYTDEEVKSYKNSSQAKNREIAYKAQKAEYTKLENQKILYEAYTNIIQNWIKEVKLRQYPDIMYKRNLDEQIPKIAVDTMLKVVQDNYWIYQKYLKIKAQKSGQNKLQIWDINRNITNIDWGIGFPSSYQFLIKTLNEFDPKQAKYTMDLFANHKVDVYPKTNKINLGYCAYDAFFESHILLNFKNQISDLNTLAHETGHAWHAYLSKKQKPQVYYCGQTLSETASIFNETLVNHAYLASLSGEHKTAFLELIFGDLASTIFKQTQYSIFEQKVYQKVLDNGSISIQEIEDIWNQEESNLNGEVVIPETSNTGAWGTVHHFFHTPFYVYAYVFGNILSLNLYRQYLQNKTSFLKTYHNILESGGSKPTYDLLLEFDLDITKPDFYEQGLKILEEVLIEFEQSL